MQALTHLELGENGLGPAGAVAVAQVLGGCAGLRRLGLRDSGVGAEGVGALAEGGSALTHFDLRGSELGEEGAAPRLCAPPLVLTGRLEVHPTA